MRGEDALSDQFVVFGPGSPPHARGRLGVKVDAGRICWITPACAGKTNFGSQPCEEEGDHPRMRGEDWSEVQIPTSRIGSPPHARGRPRVRRRRCTDGWITPACAGKTRRSSIRCGRRGITPACAGKTMRQGKSVCRGMDHPRMRGEDDATRKIRMQGNGSPPHARGRPELDKGALREMRITPACAGKTLAAVGGGDGCGDHPRMRGEDGQIDDHIGELCGSPPHARGRHGFRSLCS